MNDRLEKVKQLSQLLKTLLFAYQQVKNILPNGALDRTISACVDMAIEELDATTGADPRSGMNLAHKE